jgi:hypothetical protein
VGVIHKKMKKCGLCQLPNELEDSHLMPRSLYKALRKAIPNNHLVSSNIEDKSLYRTDKQITEYFLCKKCEGKFNEHGEKHVIDDCYKGANNFKLKDKISTSNYCFINDNEKWINPRSISGLNYKEYMYFAASIFWRASAWPNDIDGYKNSLGLKYQEEFRLYLLQEAEFPKNAYLEVYVDTANQPLPMMSVPCVISNRGCYYHEFLISGVRFCLTLGAMAGDIKQLSSAEGTQIFFIDYEFVKNNRFISLGNMLLKEYTPMGNVKNV